MSWYENRLLEQVFPNTLDESSYQWPPRLRRRVETDRLADFEFRSAVGSGLITIASERTIRTVLLSVIALLAVADIGLRRYHREQ